MRKPYHTPAGTVSAVSKTQAMFAAKKLQVRSKARRLLDEAKAKRTQPYYTGGNHG